MIGKIKSKSFEAEMIGIFSMDLKCIGEEI